MDFLQSSQCFVASVSIPVLASQHGDIIYTPNVREGVGDVGPPSLGGENLRSTMSQYEEIYFSEKQSIGF